MLQSGLSLAKQRSASLSIIAAHQEAVNLPGTGRASGEDDLDIDEIGYVRN